VARPHDGEVPLIQRRDLGELQALRDGDHRGIDDAERQIQIGALGATTGVSGSQRLCSRQEGGAEEHGVLQ
jgi:hypothetical protein